MQKTSKNYELFSSKSQINILNQYISMNTLGQVLNSQRQKINLFYEVNYLKGIF